MNNSSELLQDPHVVEAFLAGDRMVIHDLGQTYLNVMGRAPIPNEEISAFLHGSPQYLEPIGHGWGMSTDDAVRCLFDTERTKAFIQAISASVRILKSRFPGEPLSAVEAGCGTGVLAVAMAHAGIDKVKAIDINPTTAAYTEQFINALGLSDKIEVIHADATVFVPDSGIHLLVSENMHTGLYFEPQQQIVAHFLPYLEPGGVLLPQGVNLRFKLASLHWDQIGAKHTELRKAISNVWDIGETWSSWEVIEFQGQKPFDGNITGMVPFGEVANPNGLITQMEVVIDSATVNILRNAQAQFLGQPHVVQILVYDGSTQGKATQGVFSYQAGGDAPDIVQLTL